MPLSKIRCSIPEKFHAVVTCLDSGFDNSTGLFRKGLFGLFRSCNTGSILYQASLGTVITTGKIIIQSGFGKKNISVLITAFCGTEARVQFIRETGDQYCCGYLQNHQYRLLPSASFPNLFGMPRIEFGHLTISCNA